jgi:hypothetical protein
MSGNRESNKLDTLLTNEDKVNGFSIALNDDRNNIILLKWNKPVAHFFSVTKRRGDKGIPGDSER